MIELTIKRTGEDKCEGKLNVEGKGLDLVEEATSGIIEIIDAIKNLDNDMGMHVILKTALYIHGMLNDSAEGKKKERCN